MPRDDRKSLINEVKRQLRVWKDAPLMNVLQNRGIVADEAVTLDDVPDADLLRAIIKTEGEIL